MKNTIAKNIDLQTIESFDELIVAAAVCSFLNGQGGRIIIKDEVEANSLSRYLVQTIIPASPFSTSLESLEGQEVTTIDIPVGSKKPYIFDRKIYVRRGNETVLASVDEISELILARQEADKQWDRQIIHGVTLDDLDIDRIKETIVNLNKNGRGKEQADDVEGFLMHYNLLQNGSLTNAAVVLFAKYPTRFISQSRVRLSVFPTGKTCRTFEYDEFLEGNLFENVNKIEQFFAAKIGTASLFRPNSWQRVDKQLYPTHALREGVLNALIHRNYENPSGSVTIIFYADRVEITNAGELPKGLKLADLKKQHSSSPQNPDIAYTCYLHGLIEKVGRGTLNILAECKESNYAEPTWKCEMGTTSLIFYSAFMELQSETTKLNYRQKKVLGLLEINQKFASQDYLNLVQKSLNETITGRTAQNDLAALVQMGWLFQKGKNRYTEYERTQKTIEKISD